MSLVFLHNDNHYGSYQNVLEMLTDDFDFYFCFQDNYGSSDNHKVSRVKDLYKQLNLEQAFRDFEEQSFSEIMTLINSSSGSLPKDMFRVFVQKIYKREK